MATDERVEMVVAAIGSGSLPARDMVRLSADSRYEVISALAESASCPPALLGRFMQRGSQTPRHHVASNAAAPGYILGAAASSTADIDAAEAAASNPNLPIRAIRRIVRRAAEGKTEALPGHRRWRRPLVYLMAANPACPRDLLEQIAANHTDTGVVGAVLSNPSCDESMFRRLVMQMQASDAKGRDVLTALARREDCPPGILAEAVADSDRHVRLAAASNPNLPGPALAVLADDDLGEIREAATANPRIGIGALRGLAESHRSHQRATAASSPAADRALLDELAADPDRDVRAAVAQNPICAPALRLRLLRDASAEVSAAAAAGMLAAG